MQLVCADCTLFDAADVCSSKDYGRQGYCNFTTTLCNCQNGYSGAHCHIPPLKGTLTFTHERNHNDSLCMTCEPINFHLDESILFDQVLNFNLTLNDSLNELQVTPATGVNQTEFISNSGELPSTVERLFHVKWGENDTQKMEKLEDGEAECEALEIASMDVCSKEPAEKHWMELSVKFTPAKYKPPPPFHWKYTECRVEFPTLVRFFIQLIRMRQC